MPRYDSTGDLSVTLNSYTWGDPETYGSLDLIPSVSDASQIDIRYNIDYFYDSITSDQAILVDDEVNGLTADQKEIYQSLINDGAGRTFANGDIITFNELSHVVTVPQPVSVTVPDGTVDGRTIYYASSEAVSTPPVNDSTTLEIRRSTDVSQSIVTFQQGSRLTSDLLNTARDQTLHAIQEITAFGSLSSEGSGGGSGTFDGVLTDITGATTLSGAANGSVFWDNVTGSLYSSSTNAVALPPGVVPDIPADSNVIGYFLAPNSSADTDTAWVELKAAEVEMKLNETPATSGDSLYDFANATNTALSTLTLNGSLTDVTDEAPDDGDFLRWNDTAGEWELYSSIRQGDVTLSYASYYNADGVTAVGNTLGPPTSTESGQPGSTRRLNLLNSDMFPSMGVDVGDAEMLLFDNDAPKLTDGNVPGGAWVSNFTGRVKIEFSVGYTGLENGKSLNVWCGVAKNWDGDQDNSPYNVAGVIYEDIVVVEGTNDRKALSGFATVDVVEGDELTVVFSRGYQGRDADGNTDNISSVSVQYWNVDITRTDFTADIFDPNGVYGTFTQDPVNNKTDIALKAESFSASDIYLSASDTGYTRWLSGLTQTPVSSNYGPIDKEDLVAQINPYGYMYLYDSSRTTENVSRKTADSILLQPNRSHDPNEAITKLHIRHDGRSGLVYSVGGNASGSGRTDSKLEVYNVGVSSSDVSRNSRITIDPSVFGTGNEVFRCYDAAEGKNIFRVNGNGNVVATGTVTAQDIVTTSDANKKNYATLAPAPSSVAQKLQGLTSIDTFTWNDDASGKVLYGATAQDLQSVGLGILVQTDDEGSLGVDITSTIGVLMQAIKELRDENDALSARIDALENPGPTFGP